VVNKSKWKLLFSEDFKSIENASKVFRDEPPWGRFQIDRTNESQYFARSESHSKPFSRRVGRPTVDGVGIKCKRSDDLFLSRSQPYVSGCLSTHGNLDLYRGAIEVCAELPDERGVRSLISLVQANNFDQFDSPQEIVIASRSGPGHLHELHGYAHDRAYTKRVLSKVSKTRVKPGKRRYMVEIESSKIIWSIDGKQKWVVDKPVTMLNAKFSLMIALLTGTTMSWGEPSSDMGSAILDVEWVKLWETPESRRGVQPQGKRAPMVSPALNIAPLSTAPLGINTAIRLRRIRGAAFGARADKPITVTKVVSGPPAANPVPVPDPLIPASAAALDPDFTAKLQKELDEVLSTPSVDEDVTNSRVAIQPLADILRQKAKRLLDISDTVSEKRTNVQVPNKPPEKK